MEFDKAKKFLLTRIDELEKATYTFENIVKPRYEVDKQILSEIKKQYVRLDALAGKLERGEEVTREELDEAVPVQFR